ncbi:uncharacterized protein [Choristoneura fumiferana]|uniref:uncharacterized protein n=1 Tax=Choristoneura fumiferana TaxID=7141 RepID=UPI003D1567F8
MILIRINTRAPVLPIFFYFFIFAGNAYKSNSKPKKFEATLEDVYNCEEPNPAYAKVYNIIPTYSIDVINGTKYLNGDTTIVKPTAFRNFSARTFFINNGKREIKMQLVGVTCRNLFARAIIVATQIPFSLKNCMLKQGKYQYSNMDMNKIMHALPCWHAPGTIVHQLQLVSNGATEFCEEVVIEIKTI